MYTNNRAFNFFSIIILYCSQNLFTKYKENARRESGGGDSDDTCSENELEFILYFVRWFVKTRLRIPRIRRLALDNTYVEREREREREKKHRFFQCSSALRHTPYTYVLHFSFIL